MKSAFTRTGAILTALVLGTLVPQAHAGAVAIRWLVMAMLFIVFLQTRLSRTSVHRSHGFLLLANFAMGFLGWAVGWILGGRDVALAAFFAGITPTAIAAPVIIGFLRGRVDYVVAAFLLTNVIIAAVLPVILPFILGRATPDVFLHVTGSVALVVFMPMSIAYLVRAINPAAAHWPGRLQNVTFGMWVITIFLIAANASHFIRGQHEVPLTMVTRIAGASALICTANFAIGRLIGGRNFAREASQSLGQKNTMFTIYLALSYASPLIALGPTFYVLWHNLWNSWQLHRMHRRESG